jgi:catechol 2,3-dioxygenase-like lactoylglutathione lyase family enzyme
MLGGPKSAFAQTPPGAIMDGWREAVIIVPDLAPWIETLTRVGGWEVAARSPPDATLNQLWRLPEAARTQQVLMRNIGARKGYIRLVCVTGAPQQQIRPDDQAWETGGVAALDLRVTDLAATRDALHARGWRAPSDPVRYKAYGVEDLQWAPVSPDGVRLSFIQRIAPALQGWPELKHWSRAANAAISTPNIAAGQAFFTALGLREVGHTNTVGGDGPNVMGLPWQFERQLKIDIRGFAGGPDGDSAVELIAMPQAAGRDYAAAAHPPNLGIAALRVHIQNANDAAARLTTLNTPPLTPAISLQIPPYGACHAFSISSPDGVRLELFESK